MQSCVCRPLWMELGQQNVISQNNSPLNLCIGRHNLLRILMQLLISHVLKEKTFWQRMPNIQVQCPYVPRPHKSRWCYIEK